MQKETIVQHGVPDLVPPGAGAGVCVRQSDTDLLSSSTGTNVPTQVEDDNFRLSTSM